MKYEYWLNHLQNIGIGPGKRRLLKQIFGTAEEIYRQPDAALKKIPSMHRSIKEEQIQKIIESRKAWDLESYYRLEEKQVSFVTEDHPLFPKRLRMLPDGPDSLFCKGVLPADERPSAAIVGARACSNYGKEIALHFAKELASCGVQVVSGLAYGIDGYAHQGALDADGATFGVLGCGVDICYPRAHIRLYTDIQKKGGILSEFPLGTKPFPQNFPQRNRIISGLSDFLLVVEAKEKSGSLITAEHALEQGKDVYAVPGRIGDINSAGCNRLIAQGAGIAFSVEDLKKEMGLFCEKKTNISKSTKLSLVTEEKLVYSCLDLQPKSLNEIVEAAGLPVSQVLSALLSLQLKGYITEAKRSHYCLTAGSLP